jgi:hypothetical protein
MNKQIEESIKDLENNKTSKAIEVLNCFDSLLDDVEKSVSRYDINSNPLEYERLIDNISETHTLDIDLNKLLTCLGLLDCATLVNIRIKDNTRYNTELYNKTSKQEFDDKVINVLCNQIKREVVFYDSDGISSCDLSKERHEICTKHKNGANCLGCIKQWAIGEVIKND